jgi:hypothetical protein
VPGGPGVGMPGQDLCVPQRHPASNAWVIAAWRSEWALRWRGRPADVAIRWTIR